MAQRFKVAMVGCQGDVLPESEGYSYTDTIEAHPRFTIVGAADVDEAIRRSAPGGFPEVEHLLDDIKPHILALGKHCGLHLPLLHAAAAAGVQGVLCDTPNFASPADLQRILQFVHESGIKMLVPNVRRCLPAFRYAKSRYLDGSVGAPMMCIATVPTAHPANLFASLDIVRFLHDDDEVSWVFGQARENNAGAAPSHAVAYFGFESNAKALVDVGSGLTGKDAMVLIGTKGSVRIRNGNIVLVEAAEKRRRNFSNDPESQWMRCWYRILASLAEWMDGAPEPELGHSNMLKTAELSLAANLSVARGDRVDLPLDAASNAWHAEPLAAREQTP